jgi:hypothetical protein
MELRVLPSLLAGKLSPVALGRLRVNLSTDQPTSRQDNRVAESNSMFLQVREEGERQQGD